MRFLVDAQLPPALALMLDEHGHVAEHVIDVGPADILAQAGNLRFSYELEVAGRDCHEREWGTDQAMKRRLAMWWIGVLIEFDDSLIALDDDA